MAKRKRAANIATIDLSQLEKVYESNPQNSHSLYTYYFATYKFSDIESTHFKTTKYLVVHSTGGTEVSRRWSYRRRRKYLCINGPLKGQRLTATDAKALGNYCLYVKYSGGERHTELPEKVLLEATKVALELGLEW